jgi:predicted RNA methylase
VAKYIPNTRTDLSQRRLDNLLGGVSDHIKKRFRCDDEGLWSLTHHRVSAAICAELLALPDITSGSIITDAMAGAGGDSIAFARHFALVNAVEVNRERAEMLSYNRGLFAVTNMKIYRGYYQRVANQLRQDVIYFDPPWGVDYKNNPVGTLRLHVHGVNGLERIEDTIMSMHGRAKYCVVKLPYNYDIAYLLDAIAEVGRVIVGRTFDYPGTCDIHIIRFY